LPAPIAPELVRPGVFVFLGRTQPLNTVDYDVILEQFDRLLPLYEFVEGSAGAENLSSRCQLFTFRPGCSSKPSSTMASRAARELVVREEGGSGVSWGFA
jgi:hypothetical protein